MTSTTNCIAHACEKCAHVLSFMGVVLHIRLHDTAPRTFIRQFELTMTVMMMIWITRRSTCTTISSTPASHACMPKPMQPTTRIHSNIFFAHNFHFVCVCVRHFSRTSSLNCILFCIYNHVCATFEHSVVAATVAAAGSAADSAVFTFTFTSLILYECYGCTWMATPAYLPMCVILVSLAYIWLCDNAPSPLEPVFSHMIRAQFFFYSFHFDDRNIDRSTRILNI